MAGTPWPGRAGHQAVPFGREMPCLVLGRPFDTVGTKRGHPQLRSTAPGAKGTNRLRRAFAKREHTRPAIRSRWEGLCVAPFPCFASAPPRCIARRAVCGLGLCARDRGLRSHEPRRCAGVGRRRRHTARVSIERRLRVHAANTDLRPSDGQVRRMQRSVAVSRRSNVHERPVRHALRNRGRLSVRALVLRSSLRGRNVGREPLRRVRRPLPTGTDLPQRPVQEQRLPTGAHELRQRVRRPDE